MFAQKAIDEARKEKEERQREQDHWHPLVILEHTLRFITQAGRLLTERHEIRVANPTVHVYVVFVLGQNGRHPTLNVVRLEDFNGDHYRRDEQNRRGVFVI